MKTPEGRFFVSQDSKKMRQSTKVIAFAFGIGFIIFGVFGKSIYSALIGIVLLAALALNKTILVTEEGVETRYDVVFFKHSELWPYSEIEEIDKELSPDGTKMGLHFMKDVMARRLVFELHEYEDVIALAKEKNPDITLGQINK